MVSDWLDKVRSGNVRARAGRRVRHEIAVRRHRLAEPSVFIWIPKVAGTSIFRALRPYGCRRINDIDEVRSGFDSRGCVTFGHISYRALAEEGSVTEDFAKDAFRFSFVRNPYDRTVSLWAYLARFDLFPSDLPFDGFVELISGSIDPVGLHNTKGLSQCNWNAPGFWCGVGLES
ncbi:MAG: sulfotransferase family 2 domain-containing protein [Acidimicrobiaceae bacterium]|nr:sulfotransferase family 2 domain-containing protein [Acidimicrobiaceae bacterium]